MCVCIACSPVAVRHLITTEKAEGERVIQADKENVFERQLKM